MIVLEAGGAQRYMQYDLTLAGCGNYTNANFAAPASKDALQVTTSAVSAHIGTLEQVAVVRPPPPPPAQCTPASARVDQVWNNILPFGGVGSGWVYDPQSSVRLFSLSLCLYVSVFLCMSVSLDL